MAKVPALLLTALIAASAPAGGQPGPVVLGDEAAACRAGAPGPAALVRVHGFKDRAGRLRLQAYTDKPSEYLASGKYVKRVELPVSPGGDMLFCLPLPALGRYALIALHDRDADGHLSIWSDGIGFSRNPHIGLSKPKADKTVLDFGTGVQQIDIVLNYRRGLGVGPVEG